MAGKAAADARMGLNVLLGGIGRCLALMVFRQANAAGTGDRSG